MLIKISTGMLTKGLYFMMLEAGISLLAVNLPSIWLIFVRATPEAILRGMRSVASLTSSNRSNRSNSKGVDEVDGRRRSTTSASSSGNPPPSAGESYALGEVQGTPPVPEIPVDRVYGVGLEREHRGVDGEV